jgi:hypothetical protein
MMRLVTGLVLALLQPIAVPVSAQDVELSREASRSFGAATREMQPAVSRELYRQAARKYQELMFRGYYGPELARCRGSACLLAGDLAEAILAYRQGLRLNPADAKLAACLGEARAQVDSLAGHWGLTTWSAFRARLVGPAGLVFFGVWYTNTCFCLLCWWQSRSRWVGCLALCQLAIAIPWLGCLIMEASETPGEDVSSVIIAQSGVRLRQGNGFAYPEHPTAKLNPGREARLLSQREDWLQIELPGGEIGWVPRASCLLDLVTSGGARQCCQLLDRQLAFPILYLASALTIGETSRRSR